MPRGDAMAVVIDWQQNRHHDRGVAARRRTRAQTLKTACQFIGVLKVLVVLNLWGLRNTRVQLVLASVAVPGYTLVLYAHYLLGESWQANLGAACFGLLIPKSACF